MSPFSLKSATSGFCCICDRFSRVQVFAYLKMKKKTHYGKNARHVQYQLSDRSEPNVGSFSKIREPCSSILIQGYFFTWVQVPLVLSLLTHCFDSSLCALIFSSQLFHKGKSCPISYFLTAIQKVIFTSHDPTSK